MQLQNYINGSLQAPVSGQYFDDIEPATGQVMAAIPNSTAADVELAYEAAKAAFPAWSTITPQRRFEILNRIADGIEARMDEFVAAESKDTGKPMWLTNEVDIPRSVSNFRFFATGAMHFASESHFMEEGAINYTLRRPIGVVGCISPWNLPLYLFSWKIAPALAAGNTVVSKPSEITPLTAFLLSQVCIEAGLPAGVLNIVHGYGHTAGSAIVEHPGIKAVSFTGGTQTGATIARIAAPMFKKLSLELGGKNPNIIFDDCNFEEALATSIRSSFNNQGQICLCGSRIFIQEGIYERFRDAFVAKVKALSVGDPTLPGTRIGAVVSAAHKEKVLSYIALAKEEGGTVLCGGESISPEGACKDGYFLSPAVIEGLPYTCRTNQEEIFGPVVTITPFRDEEELLTMTNSVTYGLAAIIWTQDLSRAHRIAEKVEAGIVWINCWMLRDLRVPFGGVKASGVGREGGWEAFRFFTEPKNVTVKYS